MNTSVTVSLAAAMLIGAGGVATAAVAPEDEAAEVIEVLKRDAARDVRTHDSKVSAALRSTIDLSAVKYALDRTAQTVTITFSTRLVIGRDGFRQIFLTGVAAEDGNPTRYFAATNRSARARYFDVDTNQEGFCEGGSSSQDRAAEQVTLVVPFSCLDGHTSGYFQSFSLLERARGADVSSDNTRRTRDLPFTVYVPPAG